MKTQPHIPDPDGFYATLVAAHEVLSIEQSADFNARLIFLLANQVGDQATLMACINAAQAAAPEVAGAQR